MPGRQGTQVRGDVIGTDPLNIFVCSRINRQPVCLARSLVKISVTGLVNDQRRIWCQIPAVAVQSTQYSCSVRIEQQFGLETIVISEHLANLACVIDSRRERGHRGVSVVPDHQRLVLHRGYGLRRRGLRSPRSWANTQHKDAHTMPAFSSPFPMIYDTGKAIAATRPERGRRLLSTAPDAGHARNMPAASVTFLLAIFGVKSPFRESANLLVSGFQAGVTSGTPFSVRSIARNLAGFVLLAFLETPWS